MNIDEIRALRNAQPFKPFDIILRDGTKVHVILPERMALAPNGQKLGVYQGMMPIVVDVTSIAGLALTRMRKPRSRKK
jgi:hypothetical protein